MKASSRSITINVTAKNIAKGEPGDNQNCPIALALKAKGYKNVNVLTTEASFNTRSGKYYSADLPGRAQKFVERFDNRTGKGGTEMERGFAKPNRKIAPLKPFSFTVKLAA